MKYENMTKGRLIDELRETMSELSELRCRIAEVEALHTKYRETESTLRSFEKAFENMQLGVTITDMKRKILYINAADARMHGYEVAELIGEDVRIAAPNKLWKPMTHEQLEAMRSWRRDSINVKKDGTEFPVHLMSDIVTNPDGEPIGIITTCEDITERKRMEKELEKLATTDPLTGAYNRAKFEEIIGREMEMAKRYNHTLSMVMFDIDDFKEVNDTYGHIVGDHILKNITTIARENMRKTDYLVRWGGDEFMIIAPVTELEEARALAERIRKTIYTFDKTGRVTISFGVTQLKVDDTGNVFIKRADDALYKAKTNGRNCVAVNL